MGALSPNRPPGLVGCVARSWRDLYLAGTADLLQGENQLADIVPAGTLCSIPQANSEFVVQTRIV